MEGVIFDIKRYAVQDGPGIRTTVFLKGCPLHCPWCHNPEGIRPEFEMMIRDSRCLGCRECEAACPKGAVAFTGRGPVIDPDKCDLCGACADACPSEAIQRAGRLISVEQLASEVEKDRIFFEESGGGVTFSGGEPLMQPGFLTAALRACRRRGIHTVVDTSGQAPFRTIEEAAALTDLFLYDLKSVDDGKHRRFTGISNRLILSNLRRLAGNGGRIRIRIPLVPGFNDSDEDVRRSAAWIRDLGRVREVSLLPFHDIHEGKFDRLKRSNPMMKTGHLDEARVAEIRKIFEHSGLRVRIGS